MIKVVAKAAIKADKVEMFKEIALKLVESTRKEDGNISYYLCEEINNPQILTFIEEWTSKEVLKEHYNTEHFKKFVPQLKELQEGETEVNVYKIL